MWSPADLSPSRCWSYSLQPDEGHVYKGSLTPTAVFIILLSIKFKAKYNCGPQNSHLLEASCMHMHKILNKFKSGTFFIRAKSSVAVETIGCLISDGIKEYAPLNTCLLMLMLMTPTPIQYILYILRQSLWCMSQCQNFFILNTC